MGTGDIYINLDQPCSVPSGPDSAGMTYIPWNPPQPCGGCPCCPKRCCPKDRWTWPPYPQPIWVVPNPPDIYWQTNTVTFKSDYQVWNG
jgi:hypothetical protein